MNQRVSTLNSLPSSYLTTWISSHVSVFLPSTVANGSGYGALFLGRFPSPPAVRLRGTVGERRQATQEEIARWRKRVGWTRWLKGYQLLWGNLRFVRDVHVESIEPVRLGSMTQGLWQPARNERKEGHSVW